MSSHRTWSDSATRSKRLLKIGVILLALSLAALIGLKLWQPSSQGGPTPAGPLPALGIAAATIQDLDTALSDMGRTAVSWQVSYMQYTDDLNVKLLDAAELRGVRNHVVTLEIAPVDEKRVLLRIAQQEFDPRLYKIARQAVVWQKAHPDSKVIFRPLHEANGDWYPWGFRNNHNENTEGQFRQAWYHLRGVMLSASKAKDNDPPLLFMWCPNGLIEEETSYAKWYPGPNNVDYIGYDKYNRLNDGQGVWRNPTDLQIDTLKALRKVAPEKPLVVAEIGTANAWPEAAQAGQSKARWYSQLGAWLQQVAPQFNIKAVCFFIYDRTVGPNANGNDWRFYPQGRPDAVETRMQFQRSVASVLP